MPIDFSPARWDVIQETYRQWWSGELERPLIPVVRKGRDPGRPKPDVPLLNQPNCHDFSISPEAIIDRLDYELSTYTFEGDAYPFFHMTHFGPAVVALYNGARLDNSTGNVWYHPPADVPIQDLHFRFDPDNPWFRRLCDIYAAGIRRWEGQVLMGVADLGGVMDILSVFRPGEKLLYDLYDEPEEVQRLIGEAHEASHQYYQAFNEILRPVNPGYTDWGSILSDRPFQLLQCDFAYMISTEMFDQFAKPELVASCNRLDRAFYHLDGIGQLPHLDSLLEIPNLHGIQWVPGAGQPNCQHWGDVYRKIAAAGKKILIMDGFQALDVVVQQIGQTKGLILWGGWWTNPGKEEAHAALKKYGAM